MRRHPARLAEAGISPARYAELRDICRQYREMRRSVRIMGAYGAHRHAEVLEGRDPTGNTAAMAADLPEARRARIIEQAAEAVGGKIIGMAILKSVTEGAVYRALRPPCGERQFYEARLAFYVELDRRLWEREMG